jgi:hypothetical protein
MKVIEGIGVNGEMELNKEKKNIIGIFKDYHFGHNKPFIYGPRGFDNVR